MERYNIFNQIHKGLRTLLYDTALKLQQTEFAIDDEVEAVASQLNDVVCLFEEHATIEDTHILPLVFEFEPAVADVFLKEHQKDTELSDKLVAAVENLLIASNTKEKLFAGAHLYVAYDEFMLFNLKHMAKEEELLNPILWRYYEDKHIMVLQKKIVQTIPPNSALMSAKWIMRGLNNAEIIGWLKAVEKTSEESFNQLFILAEKELNKNRFNQVLEGLTEGVMIN